MVITLSLSLFRFPSLPLSLSQPISFFLSLSLLLSLGILTLRQQVPKYFSRRDHDWGHRWRWLANNLSEEDWFTWENEKEEKGFSIKSFDYKVNLFQLYYLVDI